MDAGRQIIDRRSPQPLEDFFSFFEKNSHFNAVWITYRTFLKLFEINKLLSLGSQLKKLNYPVHSALALLTGQVQGTFKRLHFKVKVSK